MIIILILTRNGFSLFLQVKIILIIKLSRLQPPNNGARCAGGQQQREVNIFYD